MPRRFACGLLGAGFVETSSKQQMKQASKSTLTERIQREAGTLTDSERVLADALAVKPDVAAFESLRRFAEIVGVNPSTLSRFVAKLGYASYRDLQLELRTAVTRMIPSPVDRARLENNEIDTQALLRMSLEDDLQQLQQLRELADTEAFMKVISLLAQAKGSIYVIGSGWSRSLADLMAHRLALCRPRVESSSSLDMLGYGKLAECGASDCAVAIASRRYSRRTIELAQALRKRGVSVISITDSSASPLVRVSSLPLIVPNMRAGPFDSPTPIAAIVHLLCSGVSHLLHASVTKRFGVIEQLSEELGTFTFDKS